MKRALITGSSGHVGSNLIRKLHEQNYTIRCIDFDGDHRAYEGYDVEIMKGDITNKDSLYPIFEDVDVVFHTAALINLDRRFRKAIEVVNIEGTRNVCDVALEQGIKKLIHFSSVDAFYRFPIDEPLLEDRKLIEDKKGMPYDYSKAEGQRIVYDYCEKGLDASVIHPTSIVGPNDFKPGLPMQAFVDMANGKRKLMPNWGYNFIDVRDLCDAAISAVKNGKTGQNYIIGGEYHMYLYIGELIGKQLGKKVVYGALPEFVTYLPLPFEYIRALFTNKPRVLTLDAIHTAQTGNKIVPSTLAREELGHKPRSIEETIFDTIDFFQKRGLVI
jgi:dihydroflavonol-4-reductase